MKVDVAEIDERIAKCRKILDNDPESQIFAALADAHRKKGNVQKALEICKNGLVKHPDYASAYIVLVKIYFDMDNYEKADMYLQKAIELGGRTRSVDILQAEIMIKMGQKSKAKSILEKLHKSDPLNETIKNMLLAVDNKDDEEESPEAENLTPVTPGSITVTPRESPAIPFPGGADGRRRYTLSNALNIIKVLPRVLGTAAATLDGILVEGHFDGLPNKEGLGAQAADVFRATAQGLAMVDLGEPLEIMIETNESKFWLIAYEKMLIIIAMRDDVNLGSLKLRVNDILKRTDF